MRRLEQQLAGAEGAIGPGAAGALRDKVDALVAAARLRLGSANGRGAADVEGSLDAGSLASAYGILAEYAEALGKMQGVLQRASRDVAVLEELKGRAGAAS